MEWQSGKVLGDEYIAPEVGDASCIRGSEKSIRTSEVHVKSIRAFRVQGEVHQSIRSSGDEVHQNSSVQVKSIRIPLVQEKSIRVSKVQKVKSIRASEVQEKSIRTSRVHEVKSIRASEVQEKSIRASRIQEVKSIRAFEVHVKSIRASGIQEVKSIRAFEVQVMKSERSGFRRSPSEVQVKFIRASGVQKKSIRGSGEVHQSIRVSGGEVHQNSCGSGYMFPEVAPGEEHCPIEVEPHLVEFTVAKQVWPSYLQHGKYAQ
ncbi:hypothetical protein V6N12_054269 [Hibiscus sabdariffa]|uniref:Uncharacterized protein n=1 Tax=Hibiscus sabdariffa TaxID=183260 RepID=A0ABR2D098_9ROSI